MANQKLLKKVAPVVLSAAMVMTSMPAAAMAADSQTAMWLRIPLKQRKHRNQKLM